jgi:type IX secretion system PorP/SprF family membrane protein
MGARLTNFCAIFLFASIATICRAQQQPLFTQYMFNGLVLNPAYAGAQETFVATALVRNQWTGMEGAPHTQTFSAHTPVDMLRHHRRQRSPVSVGLTLFNDRIAITNQTGLIASYAYRIDVARNAWLSFGLQGGVNCFRVQYSKLELDDPAFAIGDVMEWQPDFGAGAYFQSTNFYAGISSPRMLRPRIEADGTELGVAPHYFVTTGYVIDLTRDVKLKPNILLKHSGGNINQVDVNCNVYFHEALNVGVSWRTAESVGAMIQLQINPKIGFGYAHDFGLGNAISRMSSGSHEFMVNYRVPRKHIRTINPRFF